MSEKKINNLKLYQIPIDILPINVAIYSKDGDDFIVVDFNKAAQITENIKKELVVGKLLTEVFPNVKEFGLFEVFERVDKNGGHETFDLNFYKDNRISGWRRNEVIKMPNGNIMAIYEDLTKEKQLKENLKRVNSFIDNSQTIVFFWKAEEHWPVEYVSGSISDWGYSKDDFLSAKMRYEDIIHKEDLQRVNKEVEQYTKKNKDRFGQVYRIVAKDGSIHWVDDRTIIQRDSKGEVSHYLGTIIDITEQKLIEFNLKQSEEKFRTITENSLMGIFIYTDKFIYVNQALSDMIGYTQKELFEMAPYELVEDSFKEPMKNVMSRRLAGEKFNQQYSDVKFVHKNGAIKISRIMTQTIKYKDGYAGLGTVMDITDIKEIELKLKMLAQAMEQTDELVMITDSLGIITYINDAFIAHSGYKHCELIGKNPNILTSGVHTKEFFEELWQTISSGKTYTNTIVNRKKDKQLYYEEVTISPIYDDNGIIQNHISTGRDITPRIKLEKELQLRATTDNLTKIYNRYHGNEILDVEIDRMRRYGSNFAVLMFDIDHFKLVNDNFGHNIGDYVLKKLSEVVSIQMRKSDTFIRWGGEEFLIISAHIDEDKAMQFANKLRATIETYEFDSKLNITISTGVSTSREDDTKESILKRVDDALYKAKEAGRNCIKYI